jgi:hypothetical protein
VLTRQLERSAARLKESKTAEAAAATQALESRLEVRDRELRAARRERNALLAVLRSHGIAALPGSTDPPAGTGAGKHASSSRGKPGAAAPTGSAGGVHTVSAEKGAAAAEREQSTESIARQDRAGTSSSCKSGVSAKQDPVQQEGGPLLRYHHLASDSSSGSEVGSDRGEGDQEQEGPPAAASTTSP